MKKDDNNEKSKLTEEPVVIPDECGDTMWDAVLDQSPFVQAIKLAARQPAEDKKDTDQ